MRRGEIWWADLPIPTASEPGYRRPVLIVQSNYFTESRIRTVVVAAITTNTRLAEAPGNVLLEKAESPLERDSVANVSQLMTVDKGFLIEKVGELNTTMMGRISEGLQSLLSL